MANTEVRRTRCVTVTQVLVLAFVLTTGEALHHLARDDQGDSIFSASSANEQLQDAVALRRSALPKEDSKFWDEVRLSSSAVPSDAIEKKPKQKESSVSSARHPVPSLGSLIQQVLGANGPSVGLADAVINLQSASAEPTGSDIQAVNERTDDLSTKWQFPVHGDQALQKIIVVCALQIVLIAIFGWVYGSYFTYGYAKLRQVPAVMMGRQGFTFGLFHGFCCDPDCRIFCFSCFCAPVRWADTASSDRIQFMDFWLALTVFAILLVLAVVSMPMLAIALVILGVLNRQRIRRVYNMPHSTLESCCADAMTWGCCGPCAVMQEAMEVEFVEPPTQDSMLQPAMP